MCLCILICGTVRSQGRISFDTTNATLNEVIRHLGPGFFYMMSGDGQANVRRDIHISNLTQSETLRYLQTLYAVKFIYKNGQYLIVPHRVQINGYTYDGEGNALPGVNITDRATGPVGPSNSRGYFSLRVLTGSTLMFSYSGKSGKTIVVHEDSLLHVVMSDSAGQLADAFVEPHYNLGHTWIPVKTATGSFRNLRMTDVQQHPGSHLMDKLAIETGIPIQTADVLRGKLPVALRGNGTLYGDGYAFVVMDGLPQPWNSAHFDSFDIDSVTLVKDAAGGALWGARSGNGVVVLSTKKGQYKKGLQFTLLQRSAVSEKPDIHYQQGPDAASFIQWERDLFEKQTMGDASGFSPLQALLSQRAKQQINDQQLDAGIGFLQKQDIRRDLSENSHRPGSYQQYALSASNGSQNFRYYISLGTDIQRSNEKGNSVQHNNALFNTSFRNKERFEVNVSTHFSGLTTRQNALRLSSMQPYLSFRDSTGQAAWIPNRYPMPVLDALAGSHFYDWHYYPLNEIGLTDDRTQDLLFRVGAQAYYAISKWLRADVLYRYSFMHYDRNVEHAANSFFSRNLVNRFRQNQGAGYDWKVPYGSIGDEQTITGRTADSRVQLEASYEGGLFRFEAIAGAEQHLQDMHVFTDRIYGKDEGAIQSTIPYGVPLSTNPYGSSDIIPYLYAQWDSANHFQAAYFHGTVTCSHKLSLSGSIRWEQSNRFAQNTNRRALPMYSVGGAWQINDIFRMRVNYGLTGITDYNSLPFTSIARVAASYPLYTIVSPGNESLRWESQYMLNAGADFDLKKHILHGGLDYFRRRSTRVLLQGDGNTVSGFARILDNTGEISGEGIELYLETGRLRVAPDLSWQGRLSYTKTKNAMQSPRGHNWPAWNYADPSSWTARPGDPVDALYAYPNLPLDAKDGSPRGLLRGQESSDYAAILADTSADALICVGSATPLSYGSFIQTIGYRNIYLRAAFTYKGDYYLRKPGLSYYAMFKQQNGGTPEFGRRWRQPGDEARTEVPSSPLVPDMTRDIFYENSRSNVIRADHVRCQYVQAGIVCSRQDKHYPAFLQHIESVDISLSLYNAGIIWRANKDGIDPDVPEGGWPPPRTWQFSITIHW
ncbi:MAG: hypothetical protein JST39_02680 [Bacteroidetes bacterium]|nr:hypothetical protein [Bacteroidota bacterium]